MRSPSIAAAVVVLTVFFCSGNGSLETFEPSPRDVYIRLFCNRYLIRSGLTALTARFHPDITTRSALASHRPSMDHRVETVTGITSAFELSEHPRILLGGRGTPRRGVKCRGMPHIRVIPCTTALAWRLRTILTFRGCESGRGGTLASEWAREAEEEAKEKRATQNSHTIKNNT